jgi:TolB-like protein/cytochrome c-type biogenesis protein CcmH/NrfG
MSERNFFAELKRRNVYKVAVAYAVVSWLLIQVATQVFPFFEIPNWAVRLVVLLLILGFPVALILSWAFEITPEGIKRAEHVDPDQSITGHTGRKILGMTAVLGAIAAGLFVFQFVRSKSTVTPRSSEAAPGSRNASAPLSIPEKSLAVLPFENLSRDPDNAFFASGIQDEILTRLSKIGALKVISRTSTQQYQSKPQSLTEIAKQLGVANILEGSVQKVGEQVHINVQLIKAATDAHLWAESYDRELKNIFGVEGEVAGAIAEALNAKLTGAEEKAIADKPTQNAAAYDAYLRGVSIENAGGAMETYQKAATAYMDALRLDPKFALAWARLAITRSRLYFNGVDLATNSGAAVKEAADQAIALGPQLGEAWVAQGVYRYRVLRNFPSALQAYAEALKRLPNSALVLENMGHVERRLGRWEAAEKHYLTAAELDPRNLDILSTVSEVFQSLRRFKEAETMLDRILQISPGDETALANKAFIFQGEGRLEESARELAKIDANSKDDIVILARTLQLVDERRFDAAIAQIEPTTTLPKPADPRSLTLIGFCHEWAGRSSEARVTFARAVTVLRPTPESVVPVDARQLPCFLAWAYAGLGDKEKALEQARRAVADYEDDVLSKPFAEQTVAFIQARFGDLDAAFAALPHLLEVPNGITRGDLRVNPLWDPLRKDPRFAKLIAEPAPTPPLR